VELALDRLAVNFGFEILKIIPGRVSTEIDARLSFDKEATIKKAKEIIQIYKDEGIDTEKRVLVKIASTWEGLQAAKELEKENIHCNLTLLFSLAQAAVAGDVGVTLISPFVGRITDFEKAKRKVDFAAHEDPGVLSVQTIYNYLKKFGYKTVVMGASFRTMEQPLELAGCDLLTVSPNILEKLASSNVSVSRKLDVASAKTKSQYSKPLKFDQKSFLWALNQDEMAHFKLAEGIRKFTEDLELLETEIKKRLQSRL
jgi:transaldolase